MLQLENKTPFIAGFTVIPNLKGIDTLYVMVKATFAIGNQWTVAPIQIPLHQGDEYWGEPAQSSLKSASEYHPEKSASDILMFGTAWAPNQQPLYEMHAGFRVGSLQKVVKVFGDRSWFDGQISQPKPFVTMPIIYENSFGGHYKQPDNSIVSEVRNPVGKGFYDRSGITSLNGLALPNIETPNQLISHWNDNPEPIGFGPIAPNWEPRVNYAGTYDQLWQENRAPYLPDDFDPRFLNVAPSDQIYPGFLQGGEPVVISGMHPEGNLEFHLPFVKMTNRAIINGEYFTSPFQLETLALFPNQKQISLMWRAAIPCDKRMLKVERIFVSMTR